MYNNHLILAFILFLSFAVNAQKTNDTPNFEIGVGMYTMPIGKKTNNQFRHKYSYQFSVAKYLKPKGNFQFSVGINYSRNIFYYRHELEKQLSFNEDQAATSGYSDFSSISTFSNWIESFSNEYNFRLNFIGDNTDFSDDEIVILYSRFDYLLHNLGLTFSVNRFIDLKNNQIKIGLGVNPLLNLKAQRREDKYRQSPISFFSTDTGSVYFEEGVWTNRADLLDANLTTIENKINALGCQLLLSAGLVLNRRIHFMFEYRPALLSYSSEKLYLHSFGINAQYQL